MGPAALLQIIQPKHLDDPADEEKTDCWGNGGDVLVGECHAERCFRKVNLLLRKQRSRAVNQFSPCSRNVAKQGACAENTTFDS